MPDKAPENTLNETTPEKRRSRALECVAEYRKQYPGDARTDAQLLVAPYGGYELADLDANTGVQDTRGERMRRLSLNATKAEAPAPAVSPQPPPAPAQPRDEH